MRRLLLILALVASIVRVASAEPSPLGVALKDIEVAEHWIYDDLPKAVAEAKASNKPLMIVLRCVPCPPGRTLDEQVMRPTGDLARIEKQFVCVRVIQTKGLNLDVFQYDFDMSWNAMFMNADMTIYGRYGTRYSSGQGSDSNLSVAAFTKAAERALALHQNYPANKERLAGKTGKPVHWKTPEDTPGLTDRKGVETDRRNCIHCHMVKEFALRAKWQESGLVADDLYLFPAPVQIGLTLDRDDGLLVASVTPDSPAASAGVKAGDQLVLAGGQLLVSTADLTWVLHVAPHETTLPVTLLRQGQTVEARIVLSGDWKKSDIAWRASSWYSLRQGLKVDPLDAKARESRNISGAGGALEVKGLFGRGASHLQTHGLKKGDVIVEVDGRPAPATEAEFLVTLRTRHGVNDSVKFGVLREGKTVQLSIPMW